MHAAIQQAIAEGVEVFDFLSGGEAYKYIWAGEEQGSVQLPHWRTAPARLFAQARPWLRRARRAFGRSWGPWHGRFRRLDVTPGSIDVVRSAAGFEALAPEWDRLADGLRRPLLRHDWFASCIGTLHAPSDLTIVSGTSRAA